MHLASAGLDARVKAAFRMSMMMQDAPPGSVATVYDRTPLAFGLDAIGEAEPQQIIDRIVVTNVGFPNP